MSQAQSIDVRSGTPVVLLTISAGSNVLRYGTLGLDDQGLQYEPRIMHVGPINRKLDIWQNSVELSGVAIRLGNHPQRRGMAGHFNSVIEGSELLNAQATLEVVLLKEKETMHRATVFAGLVTPMVQTMEYLEIELRNDLREKIGNLQRTINKIDLPYSAERHIGAGMNIVLGTIGGEGRVHCAVIDERSGQEKICATQHACVDILTVERLRNGQRTLLSPAADYTVNLSDADSSGNAISSVSLSSGVYQQGDEFYASVHGLGESGEAISNPVTSLRKALLDFTFLEEEKLDAVSWTNATTVCSQRGYDREESFGVCIPEQAGILESGSENWRILQKICRGFDHALVITPEGRLGIRNFDITALEEAPEYFFRTEFGEFEEDTVVIDYASAPVQNSVDCSYATSHTSQNSYGSYIVGNNKVSQNTHGKRQVSFTNRSMRSSETVSDVLRRQMTLSSGKARTIQWKSPGYIGLQKGCSIGDRVAISSVGWLGDTAEQCYITGIELDVMKPAVSYTGVLLGSRYTLGSIQFSEEKLIDLTPEADTWFSSVATASVFGSDAILRHADTSISTGNYTRIAMRFDLSALPENSMIINASLRLRTDTIVDFYGGGLFLRLARLEKSDWLENGTFSNVDGLGSSWNEAWLGSQLAPTTGVQTGYCTFQFDEVGIASLNAAIGSKLNLTLLPINDREQVDFMSREHANPEWHPSLSIVYQT